ncbi:sensor histidine kinase [Hazenella coriacea]|uniref:histidine kinase n=1 Tax=Hazenella coriacea TaxID=1179467 RepID=A0A4R3L1U9_9BACL|nr:sensor histidine kinase [Hazenella coriacea]TCS93581.1 signal transduction histidine kinase [Hazenella coriacea]
MVEKRKWHWIEWLFFILLTCGFGIELFILPNSQPIFQDPQTRFWIIIMITLSYFIPLFFWRPNYIHRNGFVISVLLTTGLLELYLVYLVQHFFQITSLHVMIIGYLSTRRMLKWTIPVFVLAIPFIEFFLVLPENRVHILMMLVNLILTLGLGLSLQHFIQKNKQIQQLYQKNLQQFQLIKEQNQALELYSQQIEHLTLLRERNRMARELHDTVGHTLTSVVMGLDAAIYLIEVSPERAKEKLEVLRNVTSNGLDEVRRNIHQIAVLDEDTLSSQISNITSEFAIHTSTEISFQLKGKESELSESMKLVFLRCLQESLTNAKRHGQAAKIEVSLTYQTSQVELCVKDNGIGAEEICAGFGIESMKERLAAVHGSLSIISSLQKGTTVVCTIPLPDSLNSIKGAENY